MMTSIRSRVGAAVAIVLFAAGTAQAHPKLLAASPAAGATVAAPARIELHFNESLEASFSGGKLTSAATVAPMVARVEPTDSKTLILTPPPHLAPGVYKLTWHVVGTDTHRVEGVYVFTVR